MYGLETRDIRCPYCGETVSIVIDCSIEAQNYIEDCEVCCRPIVFNITVLEGGEPVVRMSSENE